MMPRHIMCPDALFRRLDREFGFTLDACASQVSARCDHYFDGVGLRRDWYGVVWLHPPRSEVGLWVRHAVHEALWSRATVVALVPASTGAEWWWRWALCGEIRFLPGVLRFRSVHGGPDVVERGHAVLVFRPGLPVSSLRVWWWHWSGDVDWD